MIPLPMRFTSEDDAPTPVSVLESRQWLQKTGGKMLKRIGVVAVVALAGCGDSGPSGPQIPDLSGAPWTFSSSMSASQFGISCNATGTATFSQSGSTFTGTVAQDGSCSGPGGTIDNSGTSQITGGQIDGNQLSFQVPFCSYSGTISGSNQMSGTSQCSIQEQGVTVNFTGQWQASR